MTEKNLRNRSIAAIGREEMDSSVTNANENVDAVRVQNTDPINISEANDHTANDIENQNQKVNMSAVQWKDILDAIKQVVQTEIRNETEKLKAEISKETAKQTAVLDAKLTAMSESLDDRLNLVCENLKVEMRVVDIFYRRKLGPGTEGLSHTGAQHQESRSRHYQIGAGPGQRSWECMGGRRTSFDDRLGG
jgi:hypothetical protein